MSTPNAADKMRVSFDLDEVLFVLPQTHKTEPAPPFPFNRIFRERLRLGTPDLVCRLQKLGYEVWVYTSSFRSDRYIKWLFGLYGVRFDGIVNGYRTYQLDAQDDDWEEKIIARADEIRKIEGYQGFSQLSE